MRELNFNKYLIPAILFLVIACLLIGCSSNNNENANAENANDETVTKTVYNPKTLGNFEYWIDEEWGMQNYENQMVLQNSGESEIDITYNPKSTRTPQKEAEKRIKKVKKEYQDAQVVESKEWTNSNNICGWIFKMTMFYDVTNREIEYTEVIISNEGIIRFSLTNYMKEAVSDEEFEKLVDGITVSE